MPRRAQVDPLAAAVGRRFREFREQKGWKLETLAFEDGTISKGHLSDLENGRLNPTVSTLKTLAGQLGVQLLDLVTFPEEDGRQRLVDLTRGLPEALLERWSDEAKAVQREKTPQTPPVPVVTSARPLRGAVPVVDLIDGVEAVKPDRQLTTTRWVRLTPDENRLTGAFVAKLVTDELSPRAPEGSYALFRRPGPGSRRGRLFLVELRGRGASSSELSHLVRFVETVTVGSSERLVLRALSASHPPLLVDTRRYSAAVVAEFVRMVRLDEGMRSTT